MPNHYAVIDYRPQAMSESIAGNQVIVCRKCYNILSTRNLVGLVEKISPERVTHWEEVRGFKFGLLCEVCGE